MRTLLHKAVNRIKCSSNSFFLHPNGKTFIWSTSKLFANRYLFNRSNHLVFCVWCIKTKNIGFCGGKYRKPFLGTDRVSLVKKVDYQVSFNYGKLCVMVVGKSQLEKYWYWLGWTEGKIHVIFLSDVRYIDSTSV